jgi:hypothetical protein
LAGLNSGVASSIGKPTGYMLGRRKQSGIGQNVLRRRQWRRGSITPEAFLEVGEKGMRLLNMDGNTHLFDGTIATLVDVLNLFSFSDNAQAQGCVITPFHISLRLLSYVPQGQRTRYTITMHSNLKSLWRCCSFIGLK